MANVFLAAKTLHIQDVLNNAIKHLESANFENEYGENTNLSSLAVHRIYNDIILPLFPKTKNNPNLISLDYIYAQVGLMFLRPEKTNTNYYHNFDTNFANRTVENLFEQYLVIGHVIGRLIFIETTSIDMIKV